MAVALPGDTIYVRPGIYVDSNLILSNGVNWYFEEGAIVQEVSTIFLDTLGTITTAISGWGTFKSQSSILSIANGSTISFNAKLIELLGTDAAILITSTDLSKLNINVNEIHASNSYAIKINGNSNINWTSNKITGLSTLIGIDTYANGYGNFDVQHIENTLNTSTNPIIYNDSLAFKFNLRNNTFISDVATHAIRIQPPSAITEHITNINIDLMRVTGAILHAIGSPTSNLLTEAPKIDIQIKTLANIMPSGSILEPIHLEYVIINFKASLIIHLGNPSIAFFNSPNFVQLDFNVDESASITSDWFNFTNSNSNGSNIIASGHSIFLLNGAFLYRSSWR